MDKVKHRIPGKIAEQIGAEILSGSLKPGSVLDGELSASGRWRVSRSAYREAIRILAAKGLIEARPKTGTRVSSPDNWHRLDPDVLSWMFVKEPQLDMLTKLFELRRVIEPHVASLAAERRTLTQLNEMGRALEIMARETLNRPLGREADEAFHAKIVEAAGNPFLLSLSRSIMATVTWSTIFKHRVEGLHRDSMPEHLRVYEAVAARDGERARKTMEELIDLALADTREALKPARARRRPR